MDLLGDKSRLLHLTNRLTGGRIKPDEENNDTNFVSATD